MMLIAGLLWFPVGQVVALLSSESMAQEVRPAGAPAALLPRVFRYLGALVVAIAGYGALVSGAVGPTGDYVPETTSRRPAATLTFQGTDVFITGSIDHLFKVRGFVGPNRAEKRHRERITVDVASFSRAFEEQRIRVASLRLSPPQAGDLAGPSIALLEGRRPTPTADTVLVAAIDPGVNSAALTAIDAFAPGVDAPLPLMASQQLAYARANAPVTPEYQTSTEMHASDKELWCLATGIYFEARGEAYRGQVGVAQVIMNRTKHRLYPNTICGVVFQNQHRKNACQFSFACDGIADRVGDSKSWAQAQDIARKVVSGDLYLTEVNNATHYHATYVKPHWAPRMVKISRIGQHIFYRFKRGWQFG